MPLQIPPLEPAYSDVAQHWKDVPIRLGGTTAGADTATAKFFINCLADPPEEVAAYLVPRIRRVPLDSRTLAGAIGQGSYIKYLTKSKAYGQILARLLTGARKDRFVPEE